MLILEFFSKIPDVIWAGLIASALTLSGVLLSNLSNTKRLKLQLKHDSDEKAKQRKADMRKDVYLLAAEQIVKANTHLATLPQLNFAEINPADGLQGFFAAAAKLQMIAETKTALMVSELVGAYAQLLFKLLAKVQPIHKLQTSARIAGEHYDLAQSEISRILLSMTQHNEAAVKDDARFTALNRSFELQQNHANKYSNARDEYLNKKNALLITFSKELLIEMKQIAEGSMLAMIEIRRELDVTSDIDGFKQQLHRQQTKITTQMNILLDELAKS